MQLLVIIDDQTSWWLTVIICTTIGDLVSIFVLFTVQQCVDRANMRRILLAWIITGILCRCR